MKTGKSFFFPMDKNIISPLIEWYIGKCPDLCTIFFKNKHMVQVYALSSSY